MARLFGASLLFIVVLAGCEATVPSVPPPSAGPTPGPSPTAPTSARPTESSPPAPTQAAVCPKGPLTVEGFLATDARCYVAEDVAVVGWWGERRTDDPARGVNLDQLLRGSMPFGAMSQPPENVLFVDDVAAVGPGGWPGGIHWATVTGHRSPTNDRACHYDEGPDLAPVRHCPSYLIAARVVESDPPAAALAGCAAIPGNEVGWTDVAEFTAYPPACFGSRAITVRGWFDIRSIITGWEAPWGISPGWLWVPIGPWTVVAPGSNPETSDALIVYSDPARGVDVSRTNRWVLLTGHYADTKSEACRVVYAAGYDPTSSGARIPDSFAQRLCRVHFVVTSIRETSP